MRQENVQRDVYDKLQLGVQKPSSKEHIRIEPPKDRPPNFGPAHEAYAWLGKLLIWEIYEWFAPVDGDLKRSFDELSFEEEINNNFATAFPNNRQGQWILGSIRTSPSGISVFTAADPNEPFWDINEDEIITYNELTILVKSKTTKRDMEKGRQEGAKQKALDEKRLFEERQKRKKAYRISFFGGLLDCLFSYI